MMEGKDIFVKMNGEWIPAKEYEIKVNLSVEPEVFYKVWDKETQQRLLDSAIEKEEYETAGIINKVMADTGG